MAVNDTIETEGKITSVLAGTMFRVEPSTAEIDVALNGYEGAADAKLVAVLVDLVDVDNLGSMARMISPAFSA